jgi:hypothetical protein
VEAIPRISDVEQPCEEPGGAKVGLASVACGPLAPLPYPHVSYVHVYEVWSRLELRFFGSWLVLDWVTLFGLYPSLHVIHCDEQDFP